MRSADKSAKDRPEKSEGRDFSEYQWQFPGDGRKKERVASLADMTREELQEALAMSMDHIQRIQSKVYDAAISFERWAEGLPVEEEGLPVKEEGEALDE